MPSLSQGGAVIAALSLLQPRPGHRQAFRELGEGESWFKRFGRPSIDLWKEADRLRELYPLSTSNLVMFLGIVGKLEGVLDAFRVSLSNLTGRSRKTKTMPHPANTPPQNQRAPDPTLRWVASTQDVAGMEPLVLLDDAESVMSNEQPSSSRTYGRITFSLENGHLDRNRRVHPDYSREHEPPSRRPEVGGAFSEKNMRHHSQPWQQLPYDRHSVHVVTQYYVPGDPQRAREVTWCVTTVFFRVTHQSIYKNCRVA